MLKACSMGCMALTGKEKPEIENEMTPHRLAKLMPKRKSGSRPIITMPNAWAERTKSNISSSIGRMPD